jgi:transcription elongation factor GreA
VTSPIGKALLGKKLGDEIVVQVPAGQRHYEVIDIQ